jgi:hypothetical protein
VDHLFQCCFLFHLFGLLLVFFVANDLTFFLNSVSIAMQAIYRSLIPETLIGLRSSAQSRLSTLIGSKSSTHSGFSTELGNSSRGYVRNFWDKGSAFPLPGDTAKKPTHFRHNETETVSRSYFQFRRLFSD